MTTYATYAVPVFTTPAFYEATTYYPPTYSIFVPTTTPMYPAPLGVYDEEENAEEYAQSPFEASEYPLAAATYETTTTAGYPEGTYEVYPPQESFESTDYHQEGSYEVTEYPQATFQEAAYSQYPQAAYGVTEYPQGVYETAEYSREVYEAYPQEYGTTEYLDGAYEAATQQAYQQEVFAAMTEYPQVAYEVTEYFASPPGSGEYAPEPYEGVEYARDAYGVDEYPQEAYQVAEYGQPVFPGEVVGQEQPLLSAGFPQESPAPYPPPMFESIAFPQNAYQAASSVDV